MKKNMQVMRMGCILAASVLRSLSADLRTQHHSTRPAGWPCGWPGQPCFKTPRAYSYPRQTGALPAAQGARMSSKLADTLHGKVLVQRYFAGLLLVGTVPEDTDSLPCSG